MTGNQSNQRAANSAGGFVTHETTPAASAADRLDIVYLAGTGRSGSTLVERILETFDGVSSAGEFGLTWWYVLRLGIKLDDFPCSCGTALGECPYWAEIFEVAGFSAEELSDFVRLQETTLRPRWFLPYFVPLLNRPLRRRIKELAGYYDRFYRAIAKVTGASVIIDASNLPMSALVIRLIPNVNVHIKHWVRRPEGVVCSWNPGCRRTPGPRHKRPSAGWRLT